MHTLSSASGNSFTFSKFPTDRVGSAQSTSVYCADRVIYAQGELARSIYRIEYGAVRLYRLLADGRRQVVAFQLPGETFGFEFNREHSFYAETLVNTGLTVVSKNATVDFSHDVIRLALQTMVRAQEHLLVVGRNSAVEKLAVFLVDLADRQGMDHLVELPMSRSDIGDYLGLTIETVSRSLSKLREMGIIQLRNSRCVEILKNGQLQALCK